MECFTYLTSSPSILSERTSAGLSSLASPLPCRRHCRTKVSAPFSRRHNGWMTPRERGSKLLGCIRAVKGTEKPTWDVKSWTKAPSNPPLIEKDKEEGVGPKLSNTYAAWAKPVEEVADDLRVDMNSGLNSIAVEEKRSRFGWNELAKPDRKPFWKLVAEQFEDTLVQILLAAAGVSFILALTDVEEGQIVGIEAFTEPIIILSIIVLNAVIGVWQESKAENTLQALKQMQPESARVLRNGKEIAELPARELVPGDIVELRAGDKVSADMRVAYLKSGTIRLQQASLTGESQPVLKQVEGAFDEDIELQGKENMVFSGTTVTNGMCVCIVTNTGMDTELGKIQAQIQDASLANYDSPLTRKLEEFADSLTKFVGAICVIVWLVNYKYFLTWDGSSSFPSNIDFNLEQATYYFKVAVALAVAAIPEGLPAVITTCLALGTRRMAEENAIVRKLPSVETLGCTTVICSDKTGTLTTNEMSVVQIATMQESGKMQCLTVTGTTYNPMDGEVVGLQGGLDSNIDALAQVCSVCNDAGIQCKDNRYVASGMPTEAALLVLVEKLGLQRVNTQSSCVGGQDRSGEGLDVCCTYRNACRRLFSLEFDRVRKSMGVIVEEKTAFEGKNKLLVKGAAEFVLERCASVMLKDGSIVPLVPNLREEIMATINLLAKMGLRVLACAWKQDLGPLDEYTGPDHPAHQLLMNTENYATIESQLTFLGLAGMQDPPRPEVKDAIKDCKRAGIGVVVITGDNKNTAEAICREIRLFEETEDLSFKSFLGRDFMRLSQSERRNILFGSTEKSFVFSRAEPIHKQEIVRVLKGGGDVVAMTGDGVNDAPALKLADIGIAMGITGTEVAKEASDMILADDDFATIVVAVKEGRAIYDNMKAFIRYLISSNIGELLWVNLVTDGAPATALGFNPPDKDIMERAPRSPDEGLISGWTLFRFLAVGSYVGLATVGIFVLWYINNTSCMGVDMSSDGHTAVTLDQLSHWGDCSKWLDFHPSPYTAGSQVFTFSDPCSYFTDGKVKPSTLAMSTLVVTEMFNALNALSERNSLLEVPPWVNRWLLVAIAVSMGLHITILYTPWLSEAFGVVPLNYNEWLLVLLFSFPVIPLEEALKLIGRILFTPQVKRREGL
ncbi:hypothetical protein GOP47_0005258 [Adiantum capillus-veneris]|uniref:P-type Ca(2+) transporter n=1 Tax=Adiantum capillus-veneris TaxID=13818 RepID=A0A9D4ZLE5_ADICA|nr:hypothetical protein GOP47_0005258 [Adiantum capillus-veneris]